MNEMTYGQKEEGISDYKSFEKAVAEKLKMYPFLNWRNMKSVRLCKKLYRKGYTVSDTVSFIILHS